MAPRHRIVLPVLAALLAAAAAPSSGQAALPVVELRSGPIADGKKRDARIVVRGAPQRYRGRVGIELRGNYSARFAKRSYALETRGPRGKEGRAVSLLGLPRESDYVLGAAAADGTLMRDVVAYETVRALGGAASRTRFVQLRLNGRDRGVYVLTERVRLRRGAVVELSDKPSKGGFTGPATKRPYDFYDPARDKLSKREEAALAGAVSGAELALYGGGDWRAHLDEAAAVDYLLVQELFKNLDAFHRSTFIGRPRSGPLRFGPVWDMDRSMGDTFRPFLASPEGWMTIARPWSERLLADPAFTAALQRRWAAAGPAALAAALTAVDRAERALRGAAVRNDRRWPAPGPGHAAEVRQLRAWLVARVAWMNANIQTLRAGA